MYEVEVKAAITDYISLKSQLEKLGCRFATPVVQDDHVFLPCGLTLDDMTIDTPILRLRSAHGEHTFTLKKQVATGDGLTKYERETLVSDPEALRDILIHLNFVEVTHIHKVREEGVLDDMHICLDQVEGLGAFVEIERMVTSHDEIEKAREQSLVFLTGLGITEKDLQTVGYDILQWQKRKLLSR